MKLSVIIPAYNEEINLPATLRDVYQWLTGKLPGEFEIIFVDDGSLDTTYEVAEEFLAKMPELKLFRHRYNMGKGAAVRLGMLEAKGDIRLFLDADHSTGIHEVSKVFEKMGQGADVVIASRQHPASCIVLHQAFMREYMGKFFNLMVRTMVGLPMLDTQCGFKAFTAEAAKAVFSRQRINGFSFDVEVLILSELLQLKVFEIPVSWTNAPDSRVRIIRDSLNMFLDLIRLRHMKAKGLGDPCRSCQ